MLLKNLKCTFGKIVRIGFNAILLAGMLFPGIRTQAAKASSQPSSGLQTAQNSPVGPLDDAEYTLTITSAHGTVTVSPNQATYHAGDKVHLSVTAVEEGWKFDHFSYTGSGTQIYPSGAVAISFDDGYPSTYTDVYPYMKLKGVPGTLYFICNWANKSWSLTTAQLQELGLNGWSIANHTSSHGYLDALTETQQETELLGCKNFLDGIGLTNASSHVDYPYSIWNTDTLAAMKNTGMLTGRLSSGTTFDPKNVNLLGIPSGSGDTLATVEQWTDYAVANHQIYFYHGHDIGQSGELSLADFKAWIDYLVANQIPTLTINDVYARSTSLPIDITITGNTSITAVYTQTRTISGNAGIGGAVLNFGGVSPVVADVSGNYTITVPYGWNGTVTPTRLGSSFDPTHITYSDVVVNRTDQNYTASSANTPPVIIGGTFANVTMSMNGTPTPFALTLNATDVDPLDTLTWSISSVATNGTASASGTGTSKAISYTPHTDYVGSDSFVVQVSDGTATDTITVNVTIQAAPVYNLSISKPGTGSGTVASTPDGIDCGATCSADFSYNSSVTLIATAATGSTFTGWSGDCTGTGSCEVTMSAAKSVTATFTLNKYLLTVTPAGNGSGTVTSSPTGINCGTTCSAQYDYNTTVTLTAAHATGSIFTGWSGDCTGTGSCEVSMADAKSVTATFTLNKYLLTVTPAGNGSGTVTSSPIGIDCGSTCSVQYNYNTIVTLTAAPDTGSTFTGWSGDCTGTGSCEVTMSAARSVTATFNKIIYRIYMPLIYR